MYAQHACMNDWMEGRVEATQDIMNKLNNPPPVVLKGATNAFKGAKVPYKDADRRLYPFENEFLAVISY